MTDEKDAKSSIWNGNIIATYAAAAALYAKKIKQSYATMTTTWRWSCDYTKSCTQSDSEH